MRLGAGPAMSLGQGDNARRPGSYEDVTLANKDFANMGAVAALVVGTGLGALTSLWPAAISYIYYVRYSFKERGGLLLNRAGLEGIQKETFSTDSLFQSLNP